MKSCLPGDSGNRSYMITGYDFDIHILLPKKLQRFFYMRTYGIGKDDSIQGLDDWEWCILVNHLSTSADHNHSLTFFHNSRKGSIQLLQQLFRRSHNQRAIAFKICAAPFAKRGKWNPRFRLMYRTGTDLRTKRLIGCIVIVAVI